MSKKNNKQRSKKLHKDNAEMEKERIRRMEERRKRKIVNKQSRSLLNDVLKMNIDNNGSKNNINSDVVMKNSTYVKPKKAQRVRRRDRNYILLDHRNRQSK